MAEVAFVPDVTEAWGDLVDREEYLRDDPTFGYALSPVSLVGDRDEGMDRRLIETETELAAIRGQSRVLANISPYSKAALENLRNYVIGPGFTYEAAIAEPYAKHAPQGLEGAVQREIDLFLDRNDWCGSKEKEGEILTRTVRDGEAFVSLSLSRDKLVTCRLIDPEMIVAPKSGRDLEEYIASLTGGEPLSCSFGVVTPEDDVQHVYGYHVQWTHDADFDFVESKYCEHLKLNTDSNVKRGVSDFYAVKNDLERESKLRRNTADGAALQAAIAYIREMPEGTGAGDAGTMSAANATSRRTITNSSTGAQLTRNVQKFAPGTILTTPAGAKHHAGPMGAERATVFLEVGKYLLRAIGINWCMPEYMISGDSNGSNYATALVAESPFVKARQADQRFYGKRYSNILWKMLRIATDQGRFAKYGIRAGEFRHLEQLIDIGVTYPPVESRDSEKDARVREIEHRAGVLSVKTWQHETNRDPDVEAANGAKATLPSGPLATQPQPQQGGQPAGEPVPDSQPAPTSLNGAQVTAAKGLLDGVRAGTTPPIVGVTLLKNIGVAATDAEQMVQAATPSLEHGQKCGCTACTAARTAVEAVLKDETTATRLAEAALRRRWEGYP